MKFTPAANAKGAPYATFTFQVQDDGGTANSGADLDPTPNTFTVNVTPVNVTPVNDAPVITIAGGSVTYSEGAPPVALAATLTLTDVDSATLTGATVRITGGLLSTEDVLAFTPVGSITGSYDPMTGTLTLSGTDTLANYRTALRSVTYIDPTGITNAADRTITITATDGTDTSIPVTRTVTISAFNSAPVNVLPAGLPVGLIFASEDALSIAGFGVTDNDAGTGTIVTTLSVAHGVLTLSATAPGGLTAGQVAGNGSWSVALTGTLAAINATLTAGVVYLADANYNGPDPFIISTNDQGNTGGPAKSDTDQITIAVREVNDAPTAAGDVLPAVAAGSGAVSIPVSTLLANDSRGPNDELVQTLTVTSVGNAVGGTVALSGGSVVFTPAPGFSGTASFTYTVTDNGTTNGLPDPKTATGTVSFNISASASAGPVGSGVSAGSGSTSAPVPRDPAFAFGLGAGLPALAALFNADGSVRFVVDAMPGYFGGVTVAAGDVNADGRADLVVGFVLGGFAAVEVFDGNTGGLMGTFFAAPTTAPMVLLSISDVNGDGAADIFVGPVIGLPVFGIFDGSTRTFLGLGGPGGFLGR